MIAEIHDYNGFVEMLEVKNLPEHVYCDSCGDCLVCSPHDEEEWCRTGGRWVLYVEEDAEFIAKVRNQ